MQQSEVQTDQAFPTICTVLGQNRSYYCERRTDNNQLKVYLSRFSTKI